MKLSATSSSQPKPRQIEVLILLYKFRFLTRPQIQQLIHHKHKARVINWLNDLTDKGYVHRYYSKKFAGIPSVYCLSTASHKFLKNNSELLHINPLLLKRIYREKKLSKTFREHCILTAELYLSLIKLTDDNSTKLHFYTKTDLFGMKYLIEPNPDCYFAIENKDKSIDRYFLDIFDDLPPRMLLRRRVRQYLNYYEEELWQEKTEKPFPKIIFILPDKRSKNYMERYIKGVLEDYEELEFYVNTNDLLDLFI